MALRIHFTARDLAHTRVTTGPDVMWELASSLHRLQAPRVAERYRPWLRHVRGRLDRTHLRGVVRLLTTLVPRRGDFPDFLTPPGSSGFEESLECVAATPAVRMRRELAAAFAAGRRPVPAWVRLLADGDREARRDLLTALAVYHRELLRPCLDEAREAVRGQRDVLGKHVLDGGLDQLLSSLSPSIRWTAPVLRADYPCEKELRLGGRGLTLVPSFFCCDSPVTFINPELPPVLVYPAAGQSSRPQAPQSLAAVLGRTRALAMRELLRPCSTTELARRVGVSAGTASRHAAALRKAGLITSTRQGPAVMHVATPLGRELAAPG